MKFFKMLAVVFILVVSLNAASTTQLAQEPDSELFDYMIGSWVVNRSDPSYKISGGAISTYESDGTVYYQQFSDQACTELLFDTKAKWKIKNGMLIITVLSSMRPDLHPPGLVVIDRIISINKTASILESQDGTKQYRFRSQKCLLPK